jgi:hypothetical protein
VNIDGNESFLRNYHIMYTELKKNNIDVRSTNLTSKEAKKNGLRNQIQN